MPLTLRVSSYQSHAMGPNGVRVFESGGTIGRTPNNDWVLPDPERFVSGEHAVISEEGGRYFLADHSTNGTIVNGRELPKGGRVELRSGDQVTIGSYEITVSVESASHVGRPHANAAPVDDFFFDPNPLTPGSAQPNLDPLARLGGPVPPDPAATFGADDDHAAAESAFFAPPHVVRESTPTANAGVIPENWLEADFGAAEAPLEQTSRPAAPPPSDWSANIFGVADPAGRVEPSRDAPAERGALTEWGASAERAAPQAEIGALLRAAGIDPATVDQATLASLGEILHVVVEGLIDVLKARAEIKNQFRVVMTTLKAADNNPLKFSVDASDALFNLFSRRNQSFQSPVDAFREAFDDLKAHQIAVMAGMRAAFTALLNRFDPDRLQEGFDKGLKRAAILDVINKTKYWDLYREMYEGLGDDDATFRRLFGDEFAQAYEEQMQRLTTMRRRS